MKYTNNQITKDIYVKSIFIYHAHTWQDIVPMRAAHVGLACRNSSTCSVPVPSLASPRLLQRPHGQSTAKHPGCRSWLACGQPPRRLTVQGGLLECVMSLETMDIPWSTVVLVVMEQGAEQPAGQRRHTQGQSPGGEQRKWERAGAGNEWKGSSKSPLPSDPPSFSHQSPLFYPHPLRCGSG